MIVRIISRGKSFTGLATYLTHDAAAETTERVGWTHTLNLANDDVSCAVNEMLWTARDAEYLKMEAGIRAGGRETESPVKHISLNWSPREDPSREHMIATSEEFLRHMKWQDHQAVLIAHNDKTFKHVHIMLNTVHPETGLKLDDGFEQRRAQSWALAYEREHGLHCENRLKDVREREDGPTRPAWMAFKGEEREFEQLEKSRADAKIEQENIPIKSDDRMAQEWAALRDLQREERKFFFAGGKKAFSDMRSSAHREVRDEFRERWSDHYANKKNGADPDALAETKAALIAEQKAALEERRDKAFTALRATRDGEYKELLGGQKDRRGWLSARQDSGLESLDYMDWFKIGRDSRPMVTEAPVPTQTQERAANGNSAEPPAEAGAKVSRSKPDDSRVRSNARILGSIGDGMLGIIGNFFCHITARRWSADARKHQFSPRT